MYLLVEEKGFALREKLFARVHNSFVHRTDNREVSRVPGLCQLLQLLSLLPNMQPEPVNSPLEGPNACMQVLCTVCLRLLPELCELAACAGPRPGTSVTHALEHVRNVRRSELGEALHLLLITAQHKRLHRHVLAIRFA